MLENVLSKKIGTWEKWESRVVSEDTEELIEINKEKKEELLQK